MRADFFLERLEVIGGTTPEMAAGNEMYNRMLSYLRSHKEGNENEIRKALISRVDAQGDLKSSLGVFLLRELEL